VGLRPNKISGRPPRLSKEGVLADGTGKAIKNLRDKGVIGMRILSLVFLTRHHYKIGQIQ